MERPAARAWAIPRASFVVLIPCFAMMSFFIPVAVRAGTMSSAPVIISTSIGIIFGQISFLTIWAALGPFRLWVRWLLIVATSILLYFSFFLGAIVAFPHAREQHEWKIVLLALFAPLVLLLAQFPLWIRRSISGWRIVPTDESASHSATEARQFGLRHILAMTVLLGVALSLARTAMIYLAPSSTEPPQVVYFYPHTWRDLGTFCGLLVLYNTVWMESCVRACFLARDKLAGFVAMLAVWFGVSALVIIVLTVIASVTGAGATHPAVASGVFFSFGATVVVLMLGLHLVRASGHTLIRTGSNISHADGGFRGSDLPLG